MREGSWPLQLTIRAQDGFSRELLEFAKFHQHTEVFLDGPYGSLDALDATRSADRVYFVAGGSGIAVTYPLCWAVQVSDEQHVMASARTVYSNGARSGPNSLRYEELSTTERCAHLWVRQDAQSDSWISYFPYRRAIVHQNSFSPEEADEPASEPVVQLITSKFETGGVHSLRPDIAIELREWVERSSLKRQAIVVVVSGPDGLVRDVRNAAASLALAGYDIEVHVEKFGW